jgi:hypothetical protein
MREDLDILCLQEVKKFGFLRKKMLNYIWTNIITFVSNHTDGI